MSRTVRSTPLESRAARLRLKPRKKPYRQSSAKAGLHLGYRRIENKNGSWVAFTYQGASGKYSERAFAQADDYSDADGSEVIGYFDAMKRVGGAAPPVRHGSAFTVRTAIDEYVAALELHSTTAKETEGILRHYLIEFLSRNGAHGADRLVADLTRDDFANWSSWCLSHPPRRRAKEKKAEVEEAASDDDAAEVLRRRKERINRVRNNVLACLNLALSNERVPSNVAWSKIRRFSGTEQPRVRWLELLEVKRFTDACASDFRKITQGGLLTGARWSELRRIRVEDVDLSNGTVLIARTKRKKARHIFLTDEGKRAFGDWTTGCNRNDPVFLREDGRKWGSHDQHRPILEARTAAGLDDQVTFHTLRHTYASMLVKAGVHLMIVAGSLGHRDTRMVEKHYGHLAPSHAAAAIRANLPAFGIETQRKNN